MAQGASRPVYSTDSGRLCPQCAKPLAACICKSLAKALALGDGKVRVSHDARGRGGKVVTLVRGLPLDATALAALGKELRAACGAGGTVKDGTVEIQGDHVTRVLELLTARGWKPKRAGG